MSVLLVYECFLDVILQAWQGRYHYNRNNCDDFEETLTRSGLLTFPHRRRWEESLDSQMIFQPFSSAPLKVVYNSALAANGLGEVLKYTV